MWLVALSVRDAHMFSRNFSLKVDGHTQRVPVGVDALNTCASPPRLSVAAANSPSRFSEKRRQLQPSPPHNRSPPLVVKESSLAGQCLFTIDDKFRFSAHLVWLTVVFHTKT